MIHIEKDQPVPDNLNLLVFSPTGDYNDTDLIECYGVDNPDLPASSLQAQYIKYGGLVYHYNEPKELGEAILKIDPESSHAAASYVRMSNELLKQMNAGSLEPDSLNEAMSNEQSKMQDQMDNPVTDTSPTTETQPVSQETDSAPPPISTIDDGVSTTTPPIIEAQSTTTESALENVIQTDPASTSPDVITN